MNNGILALWKPPKAVCQERKNNNKKNQCSTNKNEFHVLKYI